jgi:hypothetical protein
MALEYDAEQAPEPAFWAAVPTEERVLAVEAHHAGLGTSHPKVERPRVHAALHVVVEDQLAGNAPPEAARALARLVAAGMARHAALHAIGRIASDALAASLASGRFDAAAYTRALDALTPAAAAPTSTRSG